LKLADFKYNTQSKPLVSICVTTYNHEKYIEEAIESFLMQEVDFEVEVVIHDDASTDKTQTIIKRYHKKYPGLFKLLLQTENQRSKYGGGMQPRFNYPRAKGKYIALCEGDDYWTDRLKLQKQVDFLENNPDYILSAHCVKYFYEAKNTYGIDAHKDGNFSAIDIATKVPFQMVSVVFKKISRLNSLPSWYFQVPLGDWMLYTFLLQFGKANKMSEVMSVYRIHSAGVWSGQASNKNSKMLKSAFVMKDKFSTEINNKLHQTFLRFFMQSYTGFINTNDFEGANKLVADYDSHLPQEYLALFNSIKRYALKVNLELEQKNGLIDELFSSWSYRIGNKFVGIFGFFKNKKN